MNKYAFMLSMGVFISSSSADISEGSVTLSTRNKGYIIAQDTIVSVDTNKIDVSIRTGICYVSCTPSGCEYKIAGAYGIYQFQIPKDSIDLRFPIDTSNVALIKRKDTDSDSGIGFTSGGLNVNLAFIIRDYRGNYALFKVTHVESINNIEDPFCPTSDVLNVTFQWIYQSNGSLQFRPFTSARNNLPVRYSRQSGDGYIMALSTSSLKNNRAVYNILGRVMAPSSIDRNRHAIMIIKK